MAGSLEHRPGGILGLCRLINRHAEAIEYDLLMAGWSLDDLGYRLSWRDLYVLVKRWRLLPGTATSEALTGQEMWSPEGQLLAELVDLAAAGNWQRGGNKHAPRPKRFPRPWEKTKAQKLGSDPIPVSKFNDWWDGRSKRRKARGSRSAAD